MTSKWTYLTRTMPGIGPNLLPLETISRTKLIPALTGRPPPNETEQYLFALPARLGGIAMTNPTSTKITEALTEATLHQDSQYSEKVVDCQLEAKSEVYKLIREQTRQNSEQVKESLTQSLKHSMDLAQEKGASSWLTSLPIEEFGFALHKGAFRDALTLRYNWHPLHTPSTCGCGAKFSVEHGPVPKVGSPQ